MTVGVCAEFCAASADEDENKILIGRRYRQSKITAPRNLLMPDEFTETKAKDKLK